MFIVEMLDLPSNVSWRWDGWMKMCKGEIRRGEFADLCGVICARVSDGVGFRRMRGQVC